MKLAHTAAIREADRLMIEDHHYPGILLMEQAGRLATEAILRDFPGQDAFLVLAGPGNNGGDGFVIARCLHLAGKTVEVLLSRPAGELPATGDAAVMLRILQELPIPVSEWKPGDLPARSARHPLLVDALLGTGIDSLLRGTAAAMIREARESGLPAVAIDLPSGLDANTGQQVNEVIPARFTYTFQLPKLCHAVTPASLACGVVRVLDIGIWPGVVDQLAIRREWLTESWVRRHWRQREVNSHKGSHGHVLVVAGSKAMPGAAILAAGAALAAGAGLVSLACPGAVRLPLQTRLPEAMCLPLGSDERAQLRPEDLPELIAAMEGRQALVIGPGLGREPGTVELVRSLLQVLGQKNTATPVVVDADALYALAQGPLKLPAGAVLTPHPGEMRILSGESDVQASRLEIAETEASKRGAVVLLKGAGTVIAGPEGSTLVNPTGNPALARGGSGDVLAGMTGALLAQGYDPLVAAGLAAWLHGAAADAWVKTYSPESLSASDLIDQFRSVFPHPA